MSVQSQYDNSHGTVSYTHLRFGFRPAKIFFLASIAFRDTYDEATIKKWLTIFCRRFFPQQFKRSCLPDGPKAVSYTHLMIQKEENIRTTLNEKAKKLDADAKEFQRKLEDVYKRQI